MVRWAEEEKAGPCTSSFSSPRSTNGRDVTLINVSGKCNFNLKYATSPSVLGGALDKVKHGSENLSCS